MRQAEVAGASAAAAAAAADHTLITVQTVGGNSITRSYSNHCPNCGSARPRLLLLQLLPPPLLPPHIDLLYKSGPENTSASDAVLQRRPWREAVSTPPTMELYPNLVRTFIVQWVLATVFVPCQFEVPASRQKELWKGKGMRPNHKLLSHVLQVTVNNSRVLKNVKKQTKGNYKMNKQMLREIRRIDRVMESLKCKFRRCHRRKANNSKWTFIFTSECYYYLQN